MIFKDKSYSDDWAVVPLEDICIVKDNERIPINANERLDRITGKEQQQLFPYFGSTGQVGWIDNYLFDGVHVLLGEDAAPFYDVFKNKAYIVTGRCWVNNHAHILRSLIEPAFLCHYLNQFDYHGFVTGTTRLKLNQKSMKSMSILVAPLVEQQAIVEKLESLFSELDQGVELLTTIQQQLKRYRQAVLKAAFEGKLTGEWRSQQAELASGEELLAQIQAERVERYSEQSAAWEQAVEAWEAAGGKESGEKKPRKPTKPKELPAISGEELAELPELPEGWVWCRLGNLIETPQYGTSKKCSYEETGHGVLRIPNMSDGCVDASDLKWANFSDQEREQYALSAGDVLIIRSNGSISLVGKPALVAQSDEDFLFAGYLIRLRPISSSIVGDYLVRSLMSHRLRLQIEDKAKSSSGVNNINSGEIQSLVVSVCSATEAAVVIEELDTIFSVIDQLEEVVSSGLRQSKALRQSILKMAFEGRLLNADELAAVRADPAYEPAEQLLERIKAERELAKASKPKRKTKAKSKKAPRKSKTAGSKT